MHASHLTCDGVTEHDIPSCYTGGVVYSDILAATKPYNLAVPWGDADKTGTLFTLLQLFGHACNSSLPVGRMHHLDVAAS